MEGTESGEVLVRVVEVQEGREIGWGDNVAEQLGNRLEDTRHAIVVG